MKITSNRAPAGPAVWRTVEKDGRKYTLQVWVHNDNLEKLVEKLLKDDPKDGAHATEGNVVIELTRQS